MFNEIELFECTDLMRLRLVCATERRAKFREVMWIGETNYTLAIWMLLSGWRKVKINSDQQHVIFAHKLQTALIWHKEFWQFILNRNKFVDSVQKIFFYTLSETKLQLTVTNLSLIIIIHSAFLYVDFAVKGSKAVSYGDCRVADEWHGQLPKGALVTP
jgi:hypothetical protein